MSQLTTMNLFGAHVDSMRAKPVETNRLENNGIDDRGEDSKSDIVLRTKESVSSSSTFKGLGLCDWMCKSTLAMGFKKPTEIQSACISAILGGRDVIGVAETGFSLNAHRTCDLQK